MIKVEKIYLSYSVEDLILKDLTFSVNEGDKIALIGANGTGKTTLLKAISFLLKPSEGNIKYKNNHTFSDIRTADEFLEIHPDICMVFQDFNLFPHLNGKDNCLIGIKNNIKEENNLIKFAKYFDVEQKLEKLPHRMSKGEQQKLAIIRALIRNPSVILLDEPTSALDPHSKEKLISVLGKEIKNNNSCCIFATHDWEFASKFANRIFFLRNKSFEEYSSISELSKNLSNL